LGTELQKGKEIGTVLKIIKLKLDCFENNKTEIGLFCS